MSFPRRTKETLAVPQAAVLQVGQVVGGFIPDLLFLSGCWITIYMGHDLQLHSAPFCEPSFRYHHYPVLLHFLFWAPNRLLFVKQNLKKADEEEDKWEEE